ncbi:MAG: DedA family protein [Paludibacteraceae bacterium]|jgi:membrane protein YqaA with SNARE-associated domain|nr:DedA family protein [Paludibacteraceae bacterium]MBO5988070.1 DedA family protein [Paludibacteraceae bacterium]MEE1542878.1 YqaA family protein [Paludibacteraceae bacterium]
MFEAFSFDIADLANYGYFGLFIASFLAATILPISSEVVLSALLSFGLNAWMCLWWCTIGNTLGGMTCYLIGLMGKQDWIEKYLKVSRRQFVKVRYWMRHRGVFLAMLTFLPVVGDVIAIVLGFMRCNAWLVALFMFIGKGLRYFVWIMLNSTIMEIC